MPGKLTPELIEKLLSVDSPTVCNAIEELGVRSRKEGYMGPQIQCRFPDLGRVVGYAATCTIVEYDESYPPDPAERVKWIESIADMPNPVICVVEDRCHRKGWSSHWGEMMGTKIKSLGAQAIITDGAVRDLEALHALGMKTWSEHVVVSHGWIDVGKGDIPVEVGGLIVNPGDILHADLNGIVMIPPETLEVLPRVIDGILAREKADAAQMWIDAENRAALKKEVKH